MLQWEGLWVVAGIKKIYRSNIYHACIQADCIKKSCESSCDFFSLFFTENMTNLTTCLSFI